MPPCITEVKELFFVGKNLLKIISIIIVRNIANNEVKIKVMLSLWNFALESSNIKRAGIKIK